MDDQRQISVVRQRFDRHGNAVETLDPLATIGEPTHRRAYTYDEDGLRVVQVDIFNQAPDGTPYRLRRELQYDLLFDKVTLATAWMKVEGDNAVTSRDPTAYTYDVFGRVSSFIRPGDTSASPTFEFAYDLGSPNTRLVTRQRSQPGGPLDIEKIKCVDGRGRTYQSRTRIKDGEYIVDGFAIFNLRSQQIKAFQSYTSNSAGCDDAPPAGVLSVDYRYDGVGRQIEVIHPDDDVAGGASIERMAYEPLRVLSFDGEDSDPASPHHDTPRVRTVDGLGRVVAEERRLVGASATTQVEYDGLGYAAGYVDALGHRKAQTYDALGRLLTIVDPNSGTKRFEYDDAGNVVRRTDGRGISVAYRYDGINREVERFDADNRDATLIATEWDESPTCELSRCPNTAGRMVARTYPGGADFMGYDVRRRPLSKVRVIEGQTYELQTLYDNIDRVVERVFPDGRTLAYAYDGASRISAIPGVIDEVRYTPQGLLDSMVRPSGVVDQLRYDQRLRLAGVTVARQSGEALQGIEVVRDRASNVMSVQDDAVDALMPVTTYTYDAWYRSTAVQRGADSDTMAFDNIDSVIQRNGVGYDYADQRPGSPSRIGSDVMVYDGAGCLVSANSFEHTWDFLGRLTKSEGAAGTVDSVYGADHMRVARHVDGELTHYVARDFEVRDGISVIYPRIGRRRVARLESTDYAATWLNNVTRTGPVQLTAGAAYLRRLANEADGERWLTANARRLLAAGRPRVVGLHTDQLGSIVLATDDDGQPLGRRTFGLHGTAEAARGFVDRYGFTGQEHEPHTGLVHFAHRFLSTETGLWISPDPAFRSYASGTVDRLAEAVARYAYVLNNGGTHVDPDGLFIRRVADKIVAKLTFRATRKNRAAAKAKAAKAQKQAGLHRRRLSVANAHPDFRTDSNGRILRSDGGRRRVEYKVRRKIRVNKRTGQRTVVGRRRSRLMEPVPVFDADVIGTTFAPTTLNLPRTRSGGILDI